MGATIMAALGLILLVIGVILSVLLGGGSAVQALGLLLLLIGVVLCIVGEIWFLLVAFRESISWGLVSLFIPLVILVFLAGHWDEAKKPFAAMLLGALMYAGGRALMGELWP